MPFIACWQSLWHVCLHTRCQRSVDDMICGCVSLKQNVNQRKHSFGLTSVNKIALRAYRSCEYRFCFFHLIFTANNSRLNFFTILANLCTDERNKRKQMQLFSWQSELKLCNLKSLHFAKCKCESRKRKHDANKLNWEMLWCKQMEINKINLDLEKSLFVFYAEQLNHTQ